MKKLNTSSNAFKTGSYSALLTVIVILIALFINIIFAALPGDLTELDLSSKKLYSVTATTKAVLSGIDEEVDIYLISQSGKEDSLLTKYLEKYSSYSPKIKYQIVNPDVYPAFAQKYTKGEVTNNDVVVECGERYKYISNSQIYDIDTSTYYTNGTYKTYFDGESELTSAVDYVTREDLPKLCILTGHGEAAISDSLKNAIEKANIEYSEISLISSGSVPDDADMLMLWGIQSDISDKEKEIIAQYIFDGGKMFIASNITEQGLLENQAALLESFGIELVDGIILEGNANHFAFNAPYSIIPTVEEHDITKSLIDEKYFPVTPVVQGAYLHNVGNADTYVLLKTSDESYAKADPFNVEGTLEREENDEAGPFYTAACVQGSKSSSKIVWLGGTMLTDDSYNSYSSGANMKFIMNAFSWLSEEQTYSIVSKSVDYDYLTISESQASMLKIVMLIVIPAAFLILGILDLIFRRKLK